MILLDDLLQGPARSQVRLAGPVYARAFSAFAHDSRNVRGGELFVAVRTARADGHEYIDDAIHNGAAGVLCERPPDTAVLQSAGVTALIAKSSRHALSEWARYVLRRQSPLVIGVTGSVGKTCTTKAIATVLGLLGDDPRAIFENDNRNDTFGLPIALGDLVPSHHTAVLELASDSAGEIAELCEIASPAIGVVTNAALAHLEHFGTPERLAREYSSLATAAREHLFLNADDPHVASMSALTQTHVTQFGLAPHADVRATEVETEPLAVRFRLHWRGTQAAVRLPLLGRHNVYTGLAAAAVALHQGFSLHDVARAIETLEAPKGRLRPLAGVNQAQLIDDTFSASIPSTLAALDALGACPAPRIAVLGPVRGLERQDDAQEITTRLARFEHVIACGDEVDPFVQPLSRQLNSTTQVQITHTVEDAAREVRRLVETTPHVILIKGTEKARLERLVERLLANPSTAPAVLVRQAPGAKQVVPLHQDRAAWMEVDLSAIADNLRHLQAIAAPAKVMAVLKADAYGHGAVRVARTAVQHGASILGTAVLSEAATLRAHGITAPILVLGYTPAWQARDVVRHGVAVSLFSLDVAHHLSRAATAMECPPVPVHIKVDSGMHRLGLAPEEVIPFAREIRGLPGVRIEGLFTHFAAADGPDPTYTRTQLDRFQTVLSAWEDAGLPRPRYVHAANSAATLRFPESRFDLVRTGIALYGLHPSSVVPCPSEFQAALSLKTQIAQVKDLEVGEPVSYGCTWVAHRRSRIGVLPIGYADGFRRAPTNWGDVLVRGRRAPLVGRVCMDMCMVDLTDVPDVRVGDEVVLIGEQGDDAITAEEVAARLGTINYEVVSQILARVPRESVSR